MASRVEPEKSALIQTVIEAFRDTGNRDRAFDNVAAERLGVIETDGYCLSVLERAGGMTAGELARAAGLSPGAVTGVLDRLERAGYARRQRDSVDRRRVNIEVTPKFHAAGREIWGPLASDWNATLSSEFSADELARIGDFLRAAGEISTRHADRLRAT
jgi:DNA-binding MarR family transcriptional regulator